jgi:hypothetical protein
MGRQIAAGRDDECWNPSTRGYLYWGRIGVAAQLRALAYLEHAKGGMNEAKEVLCVQPDPRNLPEPFGHGCRHYFCASERIYREAEAWVRRRYMAGAFEGCPYAWGISAP